MSGVIILGDPHLGAGSNIGKTSVGQQLNSRVLDQLKLLDWAFSLADREMIYDIIITGDLFEESEPGQNLISEFLNWAHNCRVHNINIHLIMGNHDLKRIGGYYRSPLDVICSSALENVFVYKDISTIYINKTAYTLVPYRDRRTLECSSNIEAINKIKVALNYESAQIPLNMTKVVVGHLAIEGSIPVGNEIDDLTNELFFKPTDFSNFNFVWMGHVHKPQVMRKKNPYVAHIGSMDVSNFGETDQKKYAIIFDNKYPENFIKVEIPTRKLKKITVSIPKDTDNTTQYVIDQINSKPNLDKSIVKIDVVLEDINLKSVNRGNIEKALLNHGAFNVSKVTESKQSSLINKNINNSIDTTMDVSTALEMFADKYVDESDRTGFKELALSIYEEVKE